MLGQLYEGLLAVCIKISLNFKLHSIPLTTFLQEMATYSKWLCAWMSDCQKLLFLTFSTQITYQSFSTYWIMLETGVGTSEAVDKFTDCKRFQSLACHLGS
jgi:hypothetical protein